MVARLSRTLSGPRWRWHPSITVPPKATNPASASCQHAGGGCLPRCISARVKGASLIPAVCRGTYTRCPCTSSPKALPSFIAKCTRSIPFHWTAPISLQVGRLRPPMEHAMKIILAVTAGLTLGFSLTAALRKPKVASRVLLLEERLGRWLVTTCWVWPLGVPSVTARSIGRTRSSKVAIGRA